MKEIIEIKDIIHEFIEWFKINIPKFLEHNSSSIETRESIEALSKKLDKKMDKSTFFSIVVLIVGLCVTVIGAQWKLQSGEFDDLKEYIKEEIKDVEDDVARNSDNVSKIAEELNDVLFINLD